MRPFRHPRGTQPPQVMQAKGTALGPHTHTPAPAARGWRTPTARPVGGQSGEGERLTSDAPRNSGRHPPGDALPPPPRGAHSPKPGRGEPGPDCPPPSTPDGARDQSRTRGGARTTWKGPTSAQCRDRARCARHTTQGGGERTPRERERTHTQMGTRGLPEGQPDRARGTHRPRGMAYQRAGVRDTRTGRPVTRSAGHTGQEKGNRRDTTAGTGPSPLNRPRAARTHKGGL